MERTLPATWRLPSLPRERLWTAFNIASLVGIALAWVSIQTIGFQGDAHAYWSASAIDPYAGAQVGGPDAYLYSPLFLQISTPLRVLPWPMFYAIWTALILIAELWLVGPILLVMLLAFQSPVWADAASGNVHAFLALAIVVGLRYPVTWTFALLTKVTPGIGLIWHLVRREWGELAYAAAVSLILISISVIAQPLLWMEWIDLLHRGVAGQMGLGIIDVPLLLRAPAALVIIALAAWRGWRWLVPIGVLLSLPVIWWASLAIPLLAIPRLLGHFSLRMTDP